MPLRLAVFDFDQTLSASHVYYALAGGDGGLPVPPPYARSERGQLARIAELNSVPEIAACGGFATAAFGGNERIRVLQAFFDELRAAGVECIVCSRGNVGPIRKCLDQVGLLRHFTQVYANAGPITDGTDYDMCLPAGAVSPSDAHYLGTVSNTGWGSKGRLVAKCMRERGLKPDEAVFIDDTASEVANVKGISLTVHVQPPQGMSSRDCDVMRRLLRGPQSDAIKLSPCGEPATSERGSQVNRRTSDPAPPSQPPTPSGPRPNASGPQPQPPSVSCDAPPRSDGLPSPPPSGPLAFDDTGRRSQADDQAEWWGTPQHPPPPPPPPRRKAFPDDPRAPLAGSPAAGVADQRSFLNLGGQLWGGDFGTNQQGLGGLGRGQPRYGAGDYGRPPANLYRDDELPMPVCCWFKGKRRGQNHPPPCAVM